MPSSSFPGACGEEDAPLLRSGSCRAGVFPGLPGPVIRGVASHLRNWPSDLFLAFLAGCLVLGSLVFLILVTVAVCLPAANATRVSDGLESERPPPNVYFLQPRNRTWSTVEFCYLETAVRQNPNFQFHLVNLVNESSSNGGRPEEDLREALVRRYEHVRGIEASVGAFFRGSKLAEIAGSLDDGMLETAAKAQLLWTAPGIALDPNAYCSLKFVERFLSTHAGGARGSRAGSSVATIEPTRNIQITGVACQAFLGFLIDEIRRNGVNRSFTVERAAEKYCSRRRHCPAVRTFNFTVECSPDAVDCPIVEHHRRAAHRNNRE